MNKVSKFFHELFKPHCEHCATERRLEREEQKEQAKLQFQLEQQEFEASKYCSSCETLARENDRLVRENERLLDSLLTKPAEAATKQMDVRDLKPIQTSRQPFMPSAVRRQMLETESRHAAKLAKDAPKPDVIDKDVELQELETELDNVRKERETATSKAS
jgi:hypothetical protein